jgi:2,4-dienoyl-CoA reductase-like NADH-dependent reductase (Old Yellow Enzyme family)
MGWIPGNRRAGPQQYDAVSAGKMAVFTGVSQTMSGLFSAFRLRDVSFRNRIFVSPMCQYSARDGMPSAWHLVHYGSRASGGAGLVMLEATAVCPAGRISPFDLGIWTDDQRDAFTPIASFIREQGSVPAVQLAHAGRKASCDAPWNGGGPLAAAGGGWETWAPSALAFTPAHPVPKPLSEAEIGHVERQFVDAAQRAATAGFEVVELHMAHGYLLHEFLSPLSNQRTDRYGGSLENRARLALDITRAVRAVWPAHRPLFARLSATDWVDGGWDLAQSVQLAQWLKEAGVDFIDCSSGGLVADANVPAGPGFQVPFAATIRREAGIATGAVGFITDAVQAERIVANGEADAVLLAREFLRNPYWPLQAAQRLGVDVAWPPQYLRAKP